MRRVLQLLSLRILFTIAVLTPLIAKAQGPNITTPAPQDPPAPTGLQKAAGVAQNVAGNAGYSPDPSSPAAIAGLLVNALLGLLGIIFIILIIYAGFNWMTAQGDEEKITTAKGTITNAVIGLVVVMGAWAIYTFVANILGI